MNYLGGTTNITSAIQYARTNMFRRQNGGRDRVSKVMVLITDGETQDQNSAIEEAMISRGEGINILCLGK